MVLPSLSNKINKEGTITAQYYRQSYEPQITEYLRMTAQGVRLRAGTYPVSGASQIARALNISSQKAVAFLNGTSSLNGSQSRKLRYFLRERLNPTHRRYSAYEVATWVYYNIPFILTQDDIVAQMERRNLAYAKREPNYPWFRWYDAHGRKSLVIMYTVYRIEDESDYTVFSTPKIDVTGELVREALKAPVNLPGSSDQVAYNRSIWDSFLF